MTVFILPTTSPIKYRGKYPNRARSIGGTSSRGMGRHIELNDGTRLWSGDDRTPEFSAGSCGDDYSAIRAAAVPMTDAQYKTMLTAAELHRSLGGVAGHSRRDRITDKVRALLDTIRPAAQGVDLSKPDLPARRGAGRRVAPQVRRDNAEWHAGRDARAAGEPLEECPYSAGGERAARWDLGWREASPAHRRCGAVHVIGHHLETIRALVDGPLGESGPTDERTAAGLESILEALEGVKVKAPALRDGRPLSPLWIVDGAGDYRAGPYDTWAAADSALAMLRMDRKPDAGSLRVDGGR